MAENQYRFTAEQNCPHCHNSVPLQIVASHGLVKRYDRRPPQRGIIYELLSCPACEGISLRTYCRRVDSSDESEIEFRILYPQGHSRLDLLALHEQSRSAEKAAARAVMIRRLTVIHQCNKRN